MEEQTCDKCKFHSLDKEDIPCISCVLSHTHFEPKEKKDTFELLDDCLKIVNQMLEKINNDIKN